VASDCDLPALLGLYYCTTTLGLLIEIGLRYLFLQLTLNLDSPISASQVAGITDMPSHILSSVCVCVCGVSLKIH
jgi:hypothetical protein